MVTCSAHADADGQQPLRSRSKPLGLDGLGPKASLTTQTAKLGVSRTAGAGGPRRSPRRWLLLPQFGMQSGLAWLIHGLRSGRLPQVWEQFVAGRSTDSQRRPISQLIPFLPLLRLQFRLFHLSWTSGRADSSLVAYCASNVGDCPTERFLTVSPSSEALEQGRSALHWRCFFSYRFSRCLPIKVVTALRAGGPGVESQRVTCRPPAEETGWRWCKLDGEKVNRVRQTKRYGPESCNLDPAGQAQNDALIVTPGRTGFLDTELGTDMVRRRTQRRWNTWRRTSGRSQTPLASEPRRNGNGSFGAVVTMGPSVTKLDGVAPPPILPMRGCLERIRILMRGDRFFGRGARQRNLGTSLLGNPYKVAVFGRAEATRRYELLLRKDNNLRSLLPELSDTPLGVSLSVGTDMPRRQHHLSLQEHVPRSVRQRRRSRSGAERGSAEQTCEPWGRIPIQTKGRQLTREHQQEEQDGQAEDLRCRSGPASRWRHQVAGWWRIPEHETWLTLPSLHGLLTSCRHASPLDLLDAGKDFRVSFRRRRHRSTQEGSCRRSSRLWVWT